MELAKKFKIYKASVIVQYPVLNFIFHFITFRGFLPISSYIFLTVSIPLTITVVAFRIIGLFIRGNHFTISRSGLKIDFYDFVMFLDIIFTPIIILNLIPLDLFSFFISLSVSITIITFCIIMVLKTTWENIITPNLWELKEDQE